MDRYVPATAIAFIDIGSLPGVVDGLTDTQAWRELAPALGVSSQLRQIGLAADLVGRTGFGPEQAVIASRAQLAIAVTDLEAETGGEDGSTNIKPQVAFLIYTHSSPETTSRLLRDLASVLARRVYGESVSEQNEDYQGVSLLVFQGPQPHRQLVAASAGSVAMVANHTSAAKSCLDAIAGRTPALADDTTLKQRRPIVDPNGAVFAYVTEAGIEKLVQFGSAIVSTRFTSDADRIGSIASLFGHMSKQTTAGFLYSAEFDSDGVTERYLTALRPAVASSLARAMTPAPVGGLGALEFIPASAEDFTVISTETTGELPERVLKELSPQLDIVAGLALREFVVNFRKQLGLEPGDSLGSAVGSELVIVRFSEAEPTAMLLEVKDKAALMPTLDRYLSRDASTISRTEHNGVEILISSNRDGRSAAYLKDVLMLGTRDQVARMIDAEEGGSSLRSFPVVSQNLAARPPAASIISYKREGREAGEMMLAISRLTRVTDGSHELLEQEAVKQAMARLMPAVSFTEFRSYGVYTETRSAVGNFGLIGSVVGNGE
jgi:hypothetical protein